MPKGRIVIIPFLHGKPAADGTIIEPDIEAILEKWLERHPEFRDRKKEKKRKGDRHQIWGVPQNLWVESIEEVSWST